MDFSGIHWWVGSLLITKILVFNHLDFVPVSATTAYWLHIGPRKYLYYWRVQVATVTTRSLGLTLRTCSCPGAHRHACWAMWPNIYPYFHLFGFWVTTIHKFIPYRSCNLESLVLHTECRAFPQFCTDHFSGAEHPWVTIQSNSLVSPNSGDSLTT